MGLWYGNVLEALLLMMTSGQLRAARAMLGLDQKTLAQKSGVSLPTIQRMEASDGVVRGTVETLTKVIEALNAAGVVLIGDDAHSDRGGRGVRLSRPPRRD
jgi:predicted transcriptional regulator